MVAAPSTASLVAKAVDKKLPAAITMTVAGPAAIAPVTAPANTVAATAAAPTPQIVSNVPLTRG